MGGVSTTRNIQVIRTVKGEKGDKGDRGQAGRDGVAAQANLFLGSVFKGAFGDSEISGKWYKRKTTGTKFGDARKSTITSPVFGTNVAVIAASYDMSNTKDEWSELVFRAEKSLIRGKQYVFSIYVKGVDNEDCKFWLVGRGPGFQTAFVAGRDWKRFSYSFAAGSDSLHFSVRVWNKKGDKPSPYGIYFSAPKLEEGCVATPWCLAEEEKKGADGLTPMPNLLRNADLNPRSVSNDSEHNEGFAWRAEAANGGIIRHEPNIAAPHAGAKVVSCESFQKSTEDNDVNCIASLYQALDLTAGVTYTFSVYVKGAGAGWMIAWPIDGTHFKISGANPIDEGKNTAEGWKRYAVTFTARSTGGTNIYLRSWCNGRNDGNGGKVYFACPKLEESYKPTPWTRAQEDFRGATMRPLGDWDALPDGFKFQSGGVGEDFIDLVSVKSEGALLWWSCKRSHAKTKDTRPNVNAPFWELGQNLKFVATDLLLAKEAVIEGNILASSMSYKVDEAQEQVRGAMILQDGETHILPKLREGEVREIRVMPLPLYEGQEGLVTKINMPDEDNGYITYHTFAERANGKIRQLTKTRRYRVFNEIKYLIFLGCGKTNYTDWTLFELSIREEADRPPEGFEGIPGL